VKLPEGKESLSSGDTAVVRFRFEKCAEYLKKDQLFLLREKFVKMYGKITEIYPDEPDVDGKKLNDLKKTVEDHTKNDRDEEKKIDEVHKNSSEKKASQDTQKLHQPRKTAEEKVTSEKKIVEEAKKLDGNKQIPTSKKL